SWWARSRRFRPGRPEAPAGDANPMSIPALVPQRLRTHLKGQHVDGRLVIGALLLLACFLLGSRFDLPDFPQDYAAAWGWWHGLDPNGQTGALLARCCPDLASRYPPMQTGHPPLATVLALPLALPPFPVARSLWLLLSWAAVVAAWRIGSVRPSVCAVTAPFWLLALGMGTHEPLLFLLLALAFSRRERAPWAAGALLGICAALKAYPALL